MKDKGFLNQVKRFFSMKKEEEGGCPETVRQQEFNQEAFLGTWYETYRDGRIPFQSGDCGTAVYTERDDGLIQVTNSE